MKTKSHKTEERKEEAKKGENRIVTVIWIALAISIVAYIAGNVVLKTNITALGLAAFILFILALVVEFRFSFKNEGSKKTVIEIGGVVLAVVLIFAAVSLILRTSSPIDVIASCSMLPSFQRGDLVVLHGISNMSEFLSSHNVPVVNVSQAAYEGMVNNMESEFLEPYAYVTGNNSYFSPILLDNASNYTLGLYSLPCLDSQQGSPSPRYASCYVSPQEEADNLIRYNYSIAQLHTDTGNANIVYVPSIVIGNTTVVENYSNPIIVYRTTKTDYFSGEIIHRVFAAMKVGSDYYLLTKGDNNPILDIESLNYPVNSSDVVGYVIGHVPYIAYPSLILKGQVGAVAGCNQTIIRN